MDEKYTVFSCVGNFPCKNCEHTNCITTPNQPRRSLDGTQAIATGIFQNAPNARYLTQKEAELLVLSDKYTPAITGPSG